MRTLRFALGGPFGGVPSATKARVWASLGPTALGCSGGYLIHASFNTVSDSWGVLGWPGGIAMALTGLTVAECTCHMAFAVHGMWRTSAPDVGGPEQPGSLAGPSINNHADGDSVSFLETLLASRLSPSVAAAAAYRRKLTLVQVVGYVVVVLSMVVGMGVGLSEVRRRDGSVAPAHVAVPEVVAHDVDDGAAPRGSGLRGEGQQGGPSEQQHQHHPAAAWPRAEGMRSSGVGASSVRQG
jgi:hypothetical protein